MNRSMVLALSLLGILVLWMATGFLGDEQTHAEEATPRSSSKAPMKVKVEDFIAKEITQEIVVQGTLMPLRSVDIKSLLNTTVKTVPIDKGVAVSAGDMLVELNVEARQSQLRQAQADVAHLSLEVEAAKKLVKQGLNSETLLRSAQANLARAEAQVESAQLAMTYTKITAPFDGVWEDRHVEQGSHVDVGQSVGRLVDNSVVKAVAFVSQQAVGKLSLGQAVNVVLLDGTEATGVLTYIANVGEEETQSFRVEAEIDNADGALHAGASSEIRIETGSQLAHFVSPSAFSLSKEGVVGIKSVDDSGKVVFYPVELVRKSLDGVWVTGLPHTLTLITLGQGFVQEGEQVTAVRG